MPPTISCHILNRLRTPADRCSHSGWPFSDALLRIGSHHQDALRDAIGSPSLSFPHQSHQALLDALHAAQTVPASVFYCGAGPQHLEGPVEAAEGATPSRVDETASTRASGAHLGSEAQIGHEQPSGCVPPLGSPCPPIAAPVSAPHECAPPARVELTSKDAPTDPARRQRRGTRGQKRASKSGGDAHAS